MRQAYAEQSAHARTQTPVENASSSRIYTLFFCVKPYTKYLGCLPKPPRVQYSTTKEVFAMRLQEIYIVRIKVLWRL